MAKEDVEELKKKPFAKLFPLAIDEIEKGNCPMCKKKVGGFRDKSSEKEFKISGMCQACQDKVFGEL